MSEKKIFLAAQRFGYGSATEMINITKALQEQSSFSDAQFYFWNTPELRAIYGNSIENTTVLDNTNGESISEYFDRIKMRPDIIVSSYDSPAIFHGYSHGIPSYLYDGMLSFWEFGKDIESTRKEIMRSIYGKSPEEQEKILCNIAFKNHHHAIYLAYALSDYNFSRGADRFQCEEMLSNFPFDVQKKTSLVGAITAPDISHETEEKTKHILVSLSASRVPTVELSDNIRYAKDVINLIREKAKDISNLSWIIAVNPSLLSHLEKEHDFQECILPENLTVRPSFRYEEGQEHIRDAAAVLISPGLSTIQEAAYFETPVIFLPEQNGGQPVGYKKLCEAGYPVLKNLTLTGNGLIDLTGNFDQYPMSHMYADSHQVLTSDEFRTLRDSVFLQLQAIVEDSSVSKKIGKQQNQAIDTFIGGFRGAQEIARGISLFHK